MAGRKRKDKKPRHPGGEIKRSGKARRKIQKDEDMTNVAAEARERVFGVPKGQSRLPDAGSALGRFALAGVKNGGISLSQRDAGQLYERIVRTFEAYLMARRVRSASDFGERGGYDASDGTEPDYVARYEHAKGRYNRAVRAVALLHDHYALGTLNNVVLHDREMWERVGSLRLALNAIAHEFGDEVGKGAQAA